MNNQEQKPAITLAQWCAYLPYGLEVEIDEKGYTLAAEYTVGGVSVADAMRYNGKPLLRPMNEANLKDIESLLVDKNSDIEHYFYPNIGLFRLIGTDDYIPASKLPYDLAQKLYAAHYDLDNLIGQGLALPIE